ncbi:MAG: histidine kinase dimerization/phospho-acceptor domain-containing protein [Cyanobacteria bacterium P01_A01_bin.40]
MFDRELSLLLETRTRQVMPSNFPYLSDFVYPVPICQSGADLGSVLSIFQHLNCKLLAIPQDRGQWGLIYSEDLIGLVAEAWWGKRSAVVSHPRNIAAQQETTHLTTQDFQSIIKPAVVYDAEMELNEFLSQTQYDSIYSNQDEYLIVDAAGELKGKLDQAKIIHYLAHKSQRLSQSKTVPQLLTGIDCLRDLIDLIALPIKIETTTGKEVYRNKCWQQLVTEGSSANVVTSQTTLQQTAWSKPNHNSSSPSNHLKLEPQSINSCFILSCRTQILGSASESFVANLHSDEKTQTIKQQQRGASDPSSLPQEEESTPTWNYLRIPINGESPFQDKKDSDSYCLILATKKASHDTSSAIEPCSAQTSDIVTNKLLATISHELKSPLTGIVGLSSLLNEQKLGQLNQRQTRYVRLIHSSGQKMMGIIDDLLQLTSLAVESQEPELVNLEFLCRQLYQEAVTKIHGATLKASDLVATASDLQLDIELGSEITIANKMLLSCVISHLILETIQASESPHNLEIKISNLSGLTAIVVSCNLRDSDTWRSTPESSDSSQLNPGLDLMIAEYLAQVLEGSVTSIYSRDRCQFTLLVPKSHHQPTNNSNLFSIPQQQTKNNHQNLTILCLYPEPEAIYLETRDIGNSNFNLKSWIDNNEQQGSYQQRIIEADSLEQAHTLARIWRFDVIILDSYQIMQPDKYLRSLIESEYLAALPLITLDTRTTEAANKIEGLNVYPCLLPAQDCSVKDLMQVIKIATGT